MEDDQKELIDPDGNLLIPRSVNFEGRDIRKFATSQWSNVAQVSVAVIMLLATVMLQRNANQLVARQNELLEITTRPAIDLAISLQSDGSMQISITASRDSVFLKELEVLTFVEYRYRRREDVHYGEASNEMIVAGVFDASSPGLLSSGTPSLLTSAPNYQTRLAAICSTIGKANDRILECNSKLFLRLRYQLSTPTEFTNMYILDPSYTMALPVEGIGAYVSTWESSSTSRTIDFANPDQIKIDQYVDNQIGKDMGNCEAECDK